MTASSGYKEQVWMSRPIMWLFVALMTLLPTVMIVVPILYGSMEEAMWLIYVALGLDSFFTLLLINFAKLDISIDPTSIELKYGIVKKKVLVREVVSCEPTRARFTTFGGVGIRLGTDSSIGFTTSFGNAVKVIRRSGRLLVFSTGKPYEVSALINSLAGRRT